MQTMTSQYFATVPRTFLAGLHNKSIEIMNMTRNQMRVATQSSDQDFYDRHFGMSLCTFHAGLHNQSIEITDM